jgi:ElaA protein
MSSPDAPQEFGTTRHEVPLWTCERLQQMPSIDWHRIMRLRQEVFVVEQACIYADADAADEQSWHLCAWVPASTPAACARIVDPGVKYAEPSIGRVSTRLDLRSRGLGRELVARAIEHCVRLHPGHSIRISAQLRLERFYAGFGFKPVGETYLEDGMPHIEMLLKHDELPPT